MYLLIYGTYIAMLGFWGFSIYNRIMHTHIRFYLLSIAFLMSLWIFFRSLKNNPIGFDDTMARLLWYSYYIPIILIPLMSFLTSLSIGKSENRPLFRGHYYLCVPALLLIGLTLTNDFHQKAFSFYQGFAKWSSTYSYGVIYYIILIWVLGLSLATLWLLYKKSYIPFTKKRTLMPLAIIAVGLGYTFLYMSDMSSIGVGFIEMTAMLCFLVAAIWESYIQTGLLPSNANHGLFFERSSLQAQIFDLNDNLRYGSHSIPTNIATATSDSPSPGHWVLHTWPLQGGYALWHEDTTSLATLIESLEITKDELKKGVELLKSEIDAKAMKAHINEENRLYDLIFSHISPQLQEIQEILDMAMDMDLKSDLKIQQELLKRINLLGIHIKRKGNLILIQESNNSISSQELSYSLKEMFDSLKIWDIKSTLMTSIEGLIPLPSALAFLDFLTLIVENYLHQLTGIYASFTERDGFAILTMQLEHSDNFPNSPSERKALQLPSADLDKIKALGGTAIMEHQEKGLSYFALRLPLQPPAGGDSQ